MIYVFLNEEEIAGAGLRERTVFSYISFTSFIFVRNAHMKEEFSKAKKMLHLYQNMMVMWSLLLNQGRTQTKTHTHTLHSARVWNLSQKLSKVQ